MPKKPALSKRDVEVEALRTQLAEALRSKIETEETLRTIQHAEQALSASEARYRTLFSEMLNGGALHEILCDAAGQAVDYITLEVNRAYEALLNTRREEVVGKKASALLPPDELKKWLEIFGPVALTGESTHYEMYSPTNQKHFEGIAYCPERGQFAITFSEVTTRQQSQAALQASEEKYRHLMENVNDLICEVDAQARYQFVNAQYEHSLGYTPEELLGHYVRDLVHPDDLRQSTPSFRKLVDGRTLSRNEWRFRHKNGQWRWFDCLAQTYERSPGDVRVVVISRDITERRLNEERIAKLSRLYAMLSRVNETLVRLRETQALFLEVCRIISEAGFPLVWIGEVKERQVVPVAWCGPAADYLKRITVELEGPLGQGPTGTCIRENHPVINDDFDVNPVALPWRQPALEYGFRASAAFPLTCQGQVMGSLTLYAPEPQAFDAEQVALLEALAADISYALDANRQEQLRRQAEQALSASEEKYRRIVETAHEGIWITDAETKTTFVNQRMAEMLGYAREEMLGRSPAEFLAADQEALRLQTRRELNGGAKTQRTFKFLCRDGSVLWAISSAAPVLEPDGRHSHTISMLTDITERQQLLSQAQESAERLQAANEELQQQAEELQTSLEELAAAEARAENEQQRLAAVMEALPTGLAITDAQGGNIQANTAFEKIWGGPGPSIRTVADYRPFQAWWVETGQPVAPHDWASAQAVEKGFAVSGQMLEIQRFDGSRAFIINSAAPVHDARGRIVGSAVSIQDITALKNAEAEIQHLASFPQANPNPILEINRHGAVTYCNPAAVAWLERLGHAGEPHIFAPSDIDTLRSQLAQGEPAEYYRELPLGDAIFGEDLYLLPQFDAIRIYARDITKRFHSERERQLAEAARRLSEEKFALAFANNPAAIALTRLEDGRFLDVNQTWEALNGYCREEVVGQSARQLPIWPTAEAAAQFVKTLREEGTVRGWEQTFLKRSGEVFVAQLSAQILTVQGEQVILSTLVDITPRVRAERERQRAEEALRLSQQKNQEILESIQDGFMELDRNWQFTYLNQRAAQNVGYAPVDLIGKNIWDVFPSLLGTDQEAFYRKVMEQRQPAQMEVEGALAQRCYELHAYPSSEGLTVFWADTTERKCMEEALRASESKFMAIFQNAPMAIALSSLPHGVLVDANEAFEKLFECKKDMAVGRTSAELGIAPDPQAREQLLAQIKRQGFAHHQELVYRTMAGKPIVIWGNIDRITIDGEKFILNTFEDITERKQAMAEAEEGKRILDALMQYVPEGITLAEGPDVSIRLVSQFGQDLLGGAHNQRTAEEVAEQWTVYADDSLTPLPNEELPLVRAIHRGEVVHNQDLVQLNAQGKKLYLSCNAGPIRDAAGKITGGIVAWRDISERVRAEKLIRDQKEELQTQTEELTAQREALQSQNEELAAQQEALLQYRDELEGRVRERTAELETANTVLEGQVEERRQAEARVRQNAARLAVLAEVSEALVAAGPVYRATLDQIARAIALSIGDACLLRLLSDDGQRLELAACHHVDPDVSDTLRQVLATASSGISEGLAGRVFQSKEPAFLPTLSSEDLAHQIRPSLLPHLNQAKVTSLIVVPLMMQAQGLGTVAILRTTPECPYTTDDLKLLQSLADRVALAIANARLYRDLENALTQEQAMHQQLAQAEKLGALGRMVSSVAHELNNPLQTITNCLYLTASELPTESTIHQYLEMASSETQRLVNLVAQLRELYRPRTVAPKTHDLVPLLQNVRTLMAPQLLSGQVQWRQPADLPGFPVSIFPDRLKQVFINVVANAIEAMQPAGGQLLVDIVSSANGDQVGVRFKDTGPGISPEHLNRLFEPFFTTKSHGLGLGLAICYEIAQQHGGQITAESQLGQGAVFTVWLPIDQKAEPEHA